MTSIGARLLRTRWFVRAPIAVFRARLGFRTAIERVPMVELSWSS